MDNQSFSSTEVSILSLQNETKELNAYESICVETRSYVSVRSRRSYNKKSSSRSCKSFNSDKLDQCKCMIF